MSLQIGQQFGSFEITASLGKGGMGEVYQARDTRLDRDVAIKTLPEQLAADPDRLARLEREAKPSSHVHLMTIRRELVRTRLPARHLGLPLSGPPSSPFLSWQLSNLFAPKSGWLRDTAWPEF
jgi:serine/threonine protein kinase